HVEERRDEPERGVVDEEPDLTLGDVRAQRRDEIMPCEVERDRLYGDVMIPPDLRRRRVERAGVTIDQDQVESLCRALPRPLGAETDRRTGDERARAVPLAKAAGHGRTLA